MDFNLYLLVPRIPFRVASTRTLGNLWMEIESNPDMWRFFLDWQAGGGVQIDCVLGAFRDLSILLSHQKRGCELEDAYIALRNSIEGKFGKASKTWVSCVVHAAFARASDELSSTELILQETIPVIEALIFATAVDEAQELRFIEWVAEVGGLDAAHALLEKVHEFRRRNQSL